MGQNKPDCLGGVAHVTRDSDITFKVKRSKVNSRSSGRFTHRGLNASGSCSGVGHVKLLLRCGVLGGARRFGAHRGRRGAGISWRPPAYSLFCLGELQQIVYSRTVSDYIHAAETRANRLLGSAKPGHIEPSDRSAAKKTDDGYQGKG